MKSYGVNMNPGVGKQTDASDRLNESKSNNKKNTRDTAERFVKTLHPGEEQNINKKQNIKQEGNVKSETDYPKLNADVKTENGERIILAPVKVTEKKLVVEAATINENTRVTDKPNSKEENIVGRSLPVGPFRTYNALSDETIQRKSEFKTVEKNLATGKVLNNVADRLLKNETGNANEPIVWDKKTLNSELLKTIEREFPGFKELKKSEEKLLFLMERKEIILTKIKESSLSEPVKQRIIIDLNSMLNVKNKGVRSTIEQLKNEIATKIDSTTPVSMNTSEPVNENTFKNITKVGKLEIGEWTRNFKNEVLKLQEFRFDSPNKIQMLLRDGNEYIRLVAQKVNEAIVITTATNNETMKDKAETVLRDIRAEMRERNIEVKFNNKDENYNEKEDARDKDNRPYEEEEQFNDDGYYGFFSEEDE